ARASFESRDVADPEQIGNTIQGDGVSEILRGREILIRGRRRMDSTVAKNPAENTDDGPELRTRVLHRHVAGVEVQSETDAWPFELKLYRANIEPGEPRVAAA